MFLFLRFCCKDWFQIHFWGSIYLKKNMKQESIFSLFCYAKHKLRISLNMSHKEFFCSLLEFYQLLIGFHYHQLHLLGYLAPVHHVSMHQLPLWLFSQLSPLSDTRQNFSAKNKGMININLSQNRPLRHHIRQTNHKPQSRNCSLNTSNHGNNSKD